MFESELAFFYIGFYGIDRKLLAFGATAPLAALYGSSTPL